MRYLLILRAGEPPQEIEVERGRFAGWIQASVGDTWPGQWREVDLRSDDARDDALAATAVIVTGSSSSVTERAPWMLAAEALLRDLVSRQVPVLGICFGHQLLASALGGEVIRNPQGRETGTVEVQRAGDDPLFAGLDSCFAIQATHVDTVARLPVGARLLARTNLDATAAFGFGDHARGVQFHPEFDDEIIGRYIDLRADRIAAEGLDPAAIRARVRPTPAGTRILRNFVEKFVAR